MKQKTGFRESARIIWAIASKDIVDAIKNKLVLGILIGIGFMMLSSQALPLLLKNNSEPRAFFYDEGKSALIKEIVRSRDLDFFPSDSLQDLRVAVGASAVPVLGLVIPANFDELVEDNSPIELEGVSIHWAKPSEVAALITHFESELSSRTGQSVRIRMAQEQIYPDSQSLGFTVMIVTGLVIGVMSLGLILVPVLVMDEKENHTLEALLISPAKTYHLLIGKSLVGIFYSLLAALVMFAFTWHWIVQWDIVILAVVLGSMCAVALGLLLGSAFENFATVNMWVGGIIMVMMIPVFLWTSIVDKLSSPVKLLFQALPSLAMSKMVTFSFSDQFPLKELFTNSVVMILFIIVILSLVGWRIRRMDR